MNNLEDLDNHGQHEYPTRSELLSDAAAIEYGIREAEREERPVDDASARRIALALHGGQMSAFYAFGSSGAIDRDRIRAEFLADVRTMRNDEEALRWLGALFTYVANHKDRPAIEGWHLLTQDDGPVVAWVEGGDGQ